MAITAEFDQEPPQIPYSMRLFERVQISAMLVGWANATFTYRTLLHGKIAPAIFIIALATGTVVVAVLVFQISRRRNEFCKWMLFVLSAMATAPWFALLRHTGPADYTGTLALIQGGLQVLSLSLLMQASARAWLSSAGD
jgi:hypothetical protein